ncbi:MAG: fatty acid desaturase family protein [Devosia sp.]
MSDTTSYLDAKTIKRLSVLTPWRTALAVGLDWLVIALAIAVSQYAHNFLVYIVAVVVIGGRQHAFGALMHEFAHYRFINNKVASDWIGDVFVAWPILASVDSYRRNHLAHHRYTNTDKDPDWVVKIGTRKFTFPQEWQSAVLSLVAYVVVIGSVLDMVQAIQRLRALDTSTRAYKLTRLAFYLGWAVIFTLTGTWLQFLLYWLVPFLTVFFLVLYVRSVAEHFGGEMNYGDELGSTRTILPFFWETWFFAPHMVNYHLEHHLYPSVPYYNLPELHRALMANPTYASRAHITRGYSIGLVRECLARPAGSAA